MTKGTFVYKIRVHILCEVLLDWLLKKKKTPVNFVDCIQCDNTL